MTSPTIASPTTPPLLADLQSTIDAIQGGSWLTPGMSGTGDIAGLSNVTSPLMQVAEAGFGFVMPLIDFLDEPLKLLGGDPSAITSTAQNLSGTGQSVSALADNYQQAATTQTTGWSGPAADGYQNTSAQQTTGNAALGQASTGLSSAVSGGGAAVAETLVEVTLLIGAATAEILATCSEAAAESAAEPGDFGSAWAHAIPTIVAIAVGYGLEITEKMFELLSSAQNLSGLVQSVLSAVSEAEQLITQFTRGSNS
jgi:uncharacterized protein YukE